MRKSSLQELIVSSFQQRVYDVVRKIPRGSVLTYKQVAESIRSPRAFRAVGIALSKNHNPQIPCHRVVKSDGSLGSYNRGTALKEKLLKQEKALR